MTTTLSQCEYCGCNWINVYFLLIVASFPFNMVDLTYVFIFGIAKKYKGAIPITGRRERERGTGIWLTPWLQRKARWWTETLYRWLSGGMFVPPHACPLRWGQIGHPPSACWCWRRSGVARTCYYRDHLDNTNECGECALFAGHRSKYLPVSIISISKNPPLGSKRGRTG